MSAQAMPNHPNGPQGQVRFKPRLVLSGVLLSAIVIAVGFWIYATRINTRAFLEFRSTDSIIQEILPENLEDHEVWNELESRVASGSVSKEQAAALLALLVKGIQASDDVLKSNGKYQFLEAVVKADLASDDALIDVAEAHYGPMRMGVMGRVLAGQENQFHIHLAPENTRYPTTSLVMVWEIERVLINGQAVDFHRSKEAPLVTISYAGLKSEVANELTVELTCAYFNRYANGERRDVDGMAEATWPPPISKWQTRLKTALKVVE